MDDVLGQEAVTEFLRSRFVDPPHLILWGPSGVGKTMIANAWITEQLRTQGVTDSAHRAAMTLGLSSADDRGIAAIRQRLTDFVKRVRPVPGAFAWVLFDDADNLPVVTQQALRRILELHAHQARFIFIAQSPEHFIEPIQSRCTMLQCKPVDIAQYGTTIIARELPGISQPEEIVTLMNTISNGNVRHFMLICSSIRIALTTNGDPTIAQKTIQFLVNAPPIPLLLRLQGAVSTRDLSTITECVLSLWSKGYSFEDSIAMLETVVLLFNKGGNIKDRHYVLKCCAEGHIYQILNRMTTLDLIAVLSGQASGEALSERIEI